MGKIILFNIIMMVLSSCVNKHDDKYPCIIDFWFEINYAPGPAGLISVILIKDGELRNRLLSSRPTKHLLFKYHGAIYNIDSLRFPSPAYHIININDSTLVFGQGVAGLYEYTSSFMDSIIGITKKELVIEITDTLSGEKWIIPNCTCIDSLGILDNYYKSLREKSKYLDTMENSNAGHKISSEVAGIFNHYYSEAGFDVNGLSAKKFIFVRNLCYISDKVIRDEHRREHIANHKRTD